LDNKWLLEQIDKRGVDFQTLLERTAETLQTILESREANPDSRLKYLKLNHQRCRRIQKTYTVSEPLQRLIQQIDVHQLWVVITEIWCGDSAQIVPYIARMVELNPNIELKIIFREENPDVMDRYLTDGKRSIPKVIGFDDEGNELFQWGPRPVVLQKIFNSLKAQNTPGGEIQKHIHLWYARQGMDAIESDFKQIFRNLIQRSVSSVEKMSMVG